MLSPLVNTHTKLNNLCFIFKYSDREKIWAVGKNKLFQSFVRMSQNTPE